MATEGVAAQNCVYAQKSQLIFVENDGQNKWIYFA